MTETYKQLSRVNRIFKIVKDFENLFPEEFKKCNIKKCGHCGGTGISNKHSLNYCVYCGGIGYTGFKKINGEFVCRSCNGFGCSLCNQKGLVDWITHLRGGDLSKAKYIL